MLTATAESPTLIVTEHALLRYRQRIGPGSYRQIRRAIRAEVARSLAATACLHQPGRAFTYVVHGRAATFVLQKSSDGTDLVITLYRRGARPR